MVAAAARASTSAGRGAVRAAGHAGRTGVRAGARAGSSAARAARKSAAGARRAGARKAAGGATKLGPRKHRQTSLPSRGPRERAQQLRRRRHSAARSKGGSHEEPSLGGKAGGQKKQERSGRNRPATSARGKGSDAEQRNRKQPKGPVKQARKVARAGVDQAGNVATDFVGAGGDGASRSTGRISRATHSLIGRDAGSSDAKPQGGIDLDGMSRAATGKGVGVLAAVGRSAAATVGRASGTATRVVFSSMLGVFAILIVLVIIGVLGGMAFSMMADKKAQEEDAIRAMMARCTGNDGLPLGADGDGGSGSAPGEGALTAWQVAALADYGLRYAGVDDPSNDQLQHATAIAMAESGLRPEAHLDDRGTGDDSYGLWQINMLDEMGPERRERLNLDDNEQLYSPKINAIAMGIFYLDPAHGGGTWTEWSTYNRGDHLEFMDDAADAALDTAIMRNSDVTEVIDMVDSTVPPEIAPAGQGGGGTAESSGTPAGCPPGSGFDSNWTAYGAECPPGMDRGGGMTTHERDTATVVAMREAVVDCFGAPYGGGCYRPQNSGEHPLGRACDFMTVADAERNATGEDREWGLAMAEWLMVNAEDLDVLYVIWWDRIWNVNRDEPGPWDEWRDYTQCSSPDGPTPDAGHCHTNHVHVSVN